MTACARVRISALPENEAGALAPLALRDVDGAAAWYGAEGGLALELAFTKALESAVTTLMRNPAAGSSRHAVVLKLPQIHVWPLKRFPICCSTTSAQPTSSSGVSCTCNAIFLRG